MKTISEWLTIIVLVMLLPFIAVFIWSLKLALRLCVMGYFISTDER